MTRLPAYLLDTLREWGWRHFAWALLVGSLTVFNMGELALLKPEYKLWVVWSWNVFQFGLPYVFAVRVADRAVSDGSSPAVAYSLVVGLVVPLGVWVFGPMLIPVLGSNDAWTLRDDFGLAATRVLTLSMCTLLYVQWRRERKMLARVHAAKIERARQQQVLHSARLMALQARVEPEFLFDTLRRIRALIDQSTESAERLLTDLISLLRAMQPQGVATASTLAREIELVQAYARASEVPALQPPRLQVELGDEADSARFAPMVLLPAMRSLVREAPGVPWRVGASKSGDRLRVVIAALGQRAAATTALIAVDLASLRERLAAVHGSQAAIDCDARDTPAVRIEVPFQTDDESADR